MFLLKYFKYFSKIKLNLSQLHSSTFGGGVSLKKLISTKEQGVEHPFADRNTQQVKIKRNISNMVLDLQSL